MPYNFHGYQCQKASIKVWPVRPQTECMLQPTLKLFPQLTLYTDSHNSFKCRTSANKCITMAHADSKLKLYEKHYQTFSCWKTSGASLANKMLPVLH